MIPPPPQSSFNRYFTTDYKIKDRNQNQTLSWQSNRFLNRKTCLIGCHDRSHHPDWFVGRSRLLQELPEVEVHALGVQLLQAVVAVEDGVGGDHHHAHAVSVLAQLAADGRAHHHVQAVVGPARVAVVVAREHRLHA